MKKLNIMALICLFSLFVNRVYGQVVEVSGHVYERLAERSEPIPGVTVMIRGEKGEKGNGALTKMDGSFRLKADRNATLIFSYMGFRTVEMKVAKAKKNMDVFMEESVNTMDETVVVAYQSQSRADVGASVTVVNTKDLPPAPVSNVMELLQGRVAGLNVQQNNGAPGSIGTYTIRGISDISVQGVGDGEDEQYILGSSAPLFVIDDGIPQEDVGDYDANGLLSSSGVSPLSSLPFGYRGHYGLERCSRYGFVWFAGCIRCDFDSHQTWEILQTQIDFNGYESEYSSASSRCVGGTAENVASTNSTKRHVSLEWLL